MSTATLRRSGSWRARSSAGCVRAARQDLDPGVRFLHASYGIGALDLLRQLASDAEVLALAQVDPRALQADLSRVQDQAEAAIQRGLTA